jgi:SAM-dependent methyltransferase
MCALGDRLGLFRALGEHGPATSTELAARTGMAERYLREWLLAMSSAGYLEVDGETERFVLPPHQAAALAFDESPLYIGDMSRLVPALSMMLDSIVDGFRSGRGVPQEDYPTEFHETMWKKNTSRLGNVLVEQWIPAVDGLADRLAAGARVAQISCGNGQALILLARAFPSSRFTGYDLLGRNIERARAEAAAAGVADQVRFSQADPLDELGEGHGLIIALDALHDAPHPTATLRKVREALDPPGVFLLLETNGRSRAVDNTGPVAALLYAISTLYSVPIALAAGGSGLGMMGLPDATLRELCAQVGFGSIRPLLRPSPFNTLYELRP